jgi:hypothetical protein
VLLIVAIHGGNCKYAEYLIVGQFRISALFELTNYRIFYPTVPKEIQGKWQYNYNRPINPNRVMVLGTETHTEQSKIRRHLKEHTYCFAAGGIRCIITGNLPADLVVGDWETTATSVSGIKRGIWLP